MLGSLSVPFILVVEVFTFSVKNVDYSWKKNYLNKPSFLFYLFLV